MPTRYKIRTERDISDTALTVLGNTSGTNTGDEVVATGAEVNTGTDNDKMVTPKAIKDSILYNLPEGVMYNGKIVPSVNVSGKLIVDLKTLAGTDPSATDPVYVRINGAIRAITSALTVGADNGYNAFNAGSSELATKEIDLFVYIGFRGADSSICLGVSRIPYGKIGTDFSATFYNEKWIASNRATSDDIYVNIGRFAATLSAGAGYTWSVPTFTASNLIQRPIYETRWLDFVSTFGVDGSAPTTSAQVAKYKIRNDTCIIKIFDNYTTAGSSNTTYTVTVPFNTSQTLSIADGWIYNGSVSAHNLRSFLQTKTITNYISSTTLKQYGVFADYPI